MAAARDKESDLQTRAPWPVFDDESDTVQHHPSFEFMPANDPSEMHSFVRMTLVDYERARVCVNACAGVSSDSLELLGLGYGEENDAVACSLAKRLASAIEGLDEALEIIGPIEGDDEASELMKNIRRLQALSEQLKKGLAMKSFNERRRELIEALVEDKTGQFISNGKSDIEEVVRTGFPGFESMEWGKLVQCAHDAGLPERDSKVHEILVQGEGDLDSRQVLSKIAATTGTLSVDSGVLWFEDGTSVDLTIVATNAKEPPIVLTVVTESLGNIVLIAPEGMGIVEADELARKVTASLPPGGESGDLDVALTAYERAGFVMPRFATVEVES